ncbi:MAG: hypothetical protein OXT09_26485 [Myxococcales bacterium]|nr:hypothetical protein [Myxococcales bacterium]
MVAGQHCFGNTGSIDEGCDSLFFDDATTGVYNGQVQCFDVPAGAYPIRSHDTMDHESGSDLHVNYCSGGASTCTPAAAIPSSLRRVSN